MPPRLTDWSLALAGALAFISGIVSLDSGAPGQWTIFALHGAAGLWLLLLLRGKLVRVWPRLIHPRRWDRRTPFGLLATLAVLLALGSGIVWVTGMGGNLVVAGFNLLNWHILLGFVLIFFIALHMLARARPLRRRDVRGRRQALRFGTLLLAAAAIWPAQQTVQRLLALPGARRRFTGSYEANSYAGNIFPATSWVADNPRPLDSATWRLSVGGVVAHPLTLTRDDIIAAGDTLDATLDCTGGFYSTQRWGGIHVGRILDRAGPHPDAAWVSFLSVTGYRWALPLSEARAVLLAATVGGEPLTHEHGAPLRLVAPNRRGFQWVKWIVHLDIRTEPDPGELIAIHTSGFTPTGRGD